MCKMRKARIAYAGPALEDGTMDVRGLAPALIAFADLVKYASRAINLDKNIKVMLNQDSLKKGSFYFLAGYEPLGTSKAFHAGCGRYRTERPYGRPWMGRNGIWLGWRYLWHHQVHEGTIYQGNQA